MLNAAPSVVCDLWSHVQGVPCSGHRGWYLVPSPWITDACPEGAAPQLSYLQAHTQPVKVMDSQWSSQPQDHTVLFPEKPRSPPFSLWHRFSYNRQTGNEPLEPGWGADCTISTLFPQLLISATLCIRIHYHATFSFLHFLRHNCMHFIWAQLEHQQHIYKSSFSPSLKRI